MINKCSDTKPLQLLVLSLWLCYTCIHYPGLLLHTELMVSLLIRCTVRFAPSQLSFLGTCSSVVERSV